MMLRAASVRAQPTVRRLYTVPIRGAARFNGRHIVAVGLMGTGLGLAGLALHSAKPTKREGVEPIVVQDTSVDPPSFQSGWRRTVSMMWRWIELTGIIVPFASMLLLHQLWYIGHSISRGQLLEMLVDALERLGPVGIKWGQWASTRYDLFEDDFCQALNRLTNCAPSHSWDWTKQAIEASLQQPLSQLFDEIDEEPLASGSIGQVHVATLREDGSTVAVKVQHPNLPQRLHLDMLILQQISSIAAWIAPGMRIEETVDQFTSNFEMQLDFVDEARNLLAFESNFASSFWQSTVSFPTPLMASHDVLVESFEQGDSVSKFLEEKGDFEQGDGEWKQRPDGSWELTGIEHTPESMLRRKVAFCGVQSYLKMLIWDNMIHADLHPGNVLIREEKIGLLARIQRWCVLGDFSATVPHIVLLDAGLAAGFPESIFKNVHAFFDAVTNLNGPNLAHAILGLSPTQPYVTSREAFINDVCCKVEVQAAECNAGGGNSADNIRSYMASVREHRVVLDPAVMVALMSMLVLEGWQTRLDPSVCIMDSIKLSCEGGPMGIAIQLGRWYEATVQNLFPSQTEELPAVDASTATDQK